MLISSNIFIFSFRYQYKFKEGNFHNIRNTNHLHEEQNGDALFQNFWYSRHNIETLRAMLCNSYWRVLQHWQVFYFQFCKQSERNISMKELEFKPWTKIPGPWDYGRWVVLAYNAFWTSGLCKYAYIRSVRHGSPAVALLPIYHEKFRTNEILDLTDHLLDFTCVIS